MKNIIYLIVVLMFLISCSSTENRRNISKNYSIDKNKNIGIVVGSVTYSENGKYPNTSLVGNPDFEAFFYMQSSQTKKDIAKISTNRPVKAAASVLVSSLTMFIGRIDVVHDRSQYQDKYGQVYALELPVGKYKFIRWSLEDGPSVKYSIYPDFIPLEFEVRRGEITYIGNINLDILKKEKMWNGRYRVYDTKLTYHDDGRRDIPIFKSQFPNLQSVDVKHRVVVPKDFM